MPYRSHFRHRFSAVARFARHLLGALSALPPAPTLDYGTPAAATQGQAYSLTPTLTGAGVTCSVTSGTLPAGLSLNSSTGAITGTPTAAGDSTFTVTATNAGGSASQTITISVAASLPSGYTALLDAATLSAGAFGTPANPGSAGSTWKQNHTGITIETASGPNGRKWIKNPETNWADWIELNGKTLADMVAAGAGMFGFIVMCESAKSWCGTADNSFYSYVSAPNMSLAIDSAFASKPYTALTWRAGVFRWNGSKSYLRLNGDATWAEGADGTFSALTSNLRLCGDGWLAATCGVSLFASYAAQSEANGDALLDYLAGLL